MKKKRYLPFGYQMNEGNIMTEYEERFSKMGNNINKLIANR